MKTLILDTESNGMKPEQICQLSYIISEDGDVRARNFFFSVDCMNEYALKKHHLSKHRLYFLSEGKRFSDLLPRFIDDLMNADIFCGHNVAADLRMLDIELERNGLSLPHHNCFCTMKHYDTAMHLKGKTGQHKPPRLDELCHYFRLDDQKIMHACNMLYGNKRYLSHDARFDSTATYLCIYEAQLRGDVRGVI